MIGLYPDCPGEPYYTLTSPRFDRVEIDTAQGTILIEAQRTTDDDSIIERMWLGGKPLTKYRISHDELMKNRQIILKLKPNENI